MSSKPVEERITESLQLTKPPGHQTVHPFAFRQDSIQTSLDKEAYLPNLKYLEDRMTSLS